jgi:hypothetical protein
MEAFTRNIFARAFGLADALRSMRVAVATHRTDPRLLPQIEEALQDRADDVRMLGETLSFMSDALDTLELPTIPKENAGASLYRRLSFQSTATQLASRVLDLRKAVDEARAELLHM